MKKHLVFILLLSVGPIFANTRFVGGTETTLSLTNFDVSSLPIEDTYINLDTQIYAGFTTSKFIGFNQLTISLSPGVRISQQYGPTSLQKPILDANFMFYEAFLRYDGLSVSFNIGKSLLGWGQGTSRQYAFIVSDAFRDGVNRFYNAEILYRKGPTLLSMGFGMDTDSIDRFEDPKWFSPWVYVKHDQSSYTLLGGVLVEHNLDDGNDVKAVFEFQYFLPKNFEIYSTFAYLLLEDDKIGKEDQIQFLAGLKYEQRFGGNITLIPRIEYFVEQKNHFISFGITSLLYQLELTIFNTFSYRFDDTWDNNILTRLKWNVSPNFKVLLEHRAFFFEEKSLVTIQHIAEMKMEIFF